LAYRNWEPMVQIHLPPAASHQRTVPAVGFAGHVTASDLHTITRPLQEGAVHTLRCSLNEVSIHGTAQWFSKLATPRQGHGRAVGCDRWATSLGYRLCVKPKYARAPATRTPSQLTQNATWRCGKKKTWTTAPPPLDGNYRSHPSRSRPAPWRNPRRPSMGFAPENQVRTGLPAGGRWIRTSGPQR
jgi:hypothetical protein